MILKGVWVRRYTGVMRRLRVCPDYKIVFVSGNRQTDKEKQHTSLSNDRHFNRKPSERPALFDGRTPWDSIGEFNVKLCWQIVLIGRGRRVQLSGVESW